MKNRPDNTDTSPVTPNVAPEPQPAPETPPAEVDRPEPMVDNES